MVMQEAQNEPPSCWTGCEMTAAGLCIGLLKWLSANDCVWNGSPMEPKVPRFHTKVPLKKVLTKVQDFQGFTQTLKNSGSPEFHTTKSYIKAPLERSHKSAGSPRFHMQVALLKVQVAKVPHEGSTLKSSGSERVHS